MRRRLIFENKRGCKRMNKNDGEALFLPSPADDLKRSAREANKALIKHRRALKKFQRGELSREELDAAAEAAARAREEMMRTMNR